MGDRGDGVEGKQLGDGMVNKPMLPNAVTVEEAKEEVVSRVEKDHDEIMEVVETKVAGLQEGLESLEALAMDSVQAMWFPFQQLHLLPFHQCYRLQRLLWSPQKF